MHDDWYYTYVWQVFSRVVSQGLSQVGCTILWVTQMAQIHSKTILIPLKLVPACGNWYAD